MHENQNSRIWSDIYGGKKNHEGPTWAKEKSKAGSTTTPKHYFMFTPETVKNFFNFHTPSNVCVCVEVKKK